MNEKSLFVQLAAILTSVCLVTIAGISSANGCSEESSKKDVKITYGDSHLSVDTKQKPVKHDDWLVFDLKPDMQIGPPPREVDFKRVMVKVFGKGPESYWIAASGTFDGTGGQLKVCVPSSTEYRIYEYVVEIDEVGKLDPRVIVEQ
jgi:hypothetical protein